MYVCMYINSYIFVYAYIYIYVYICTHTLADPLSPASPIRLIAFSRLINKCHHRNFCLFTQRPVRL